MSFSRPQALLTPNWLRKLTNANFAFRKYASYDEVPTGRKLRRHLEREEKREAKRNAKN